jgi:P4 family phage/plasmid primase-like protien
VAGTSNGRLDSACLLHTIPCRAPARKQPNWTLTPRPVIHMASEKVASWQRFRDGYPCPVCGGHADLPQGEGTRCYGFMGREGDVAMCTRGEHAGRLADREWGTLHVLNGDCPCGETHDEVDFAAFRNGHAQRSGRGQHATARNGHTPRQYEKVRNWHVVKKYKLLRADGTLAGLHVRWEGTRVSDGQPAKMYTWRDHNTLPIVEMPLYGLRDVLAAPAGSRVYLTEGEKARDALTAHGLLAAGTVTGASATPCDDTLRALARYDVVLWPDNDEPGAGHMARIAERLRALGTADVAWVTWPDAPPKADAADYFADPLHAPETLASLVCAPPPHDPPQLNGHGGGGGGGPNYAWNDSGNAERLFDAGARGRVLYVDKRVFPWHVWDGNCWLEDRENRLGTWMKETLRVACAAVWQNGQPRATQTDEAKFLVGSGNSPKIKAALTAMSLTTGVTVLPETLDRHDWYLPCNNGLTYDFETGQVITSLPEHRMTRCVPVPAITSPAAHPKWDAMLDLVTGGDAELVRYLRWTMGLFGTGYVGEKSFWFWWGKTNAGKTTVLTLLARLLGPFVYAIPLRALLRHRQDTGILHDIAGLRGVRLAYAEEFRPGDVLDISWVKKISGGGDITADRKGEPDETFASTAKLVIGTNDLPNITDIDDALRGRVREVPFPADIPAVFAARGQARMSVEEAVEDLMTEAPAILYDLLLAVREWRAAGGNSVCQRQSRRTASTTSTSKTRCWRGCRCAASPGRGGNRTKPRSNRSACGGQASACNRGAPGNRHRARGSVGNWPPTSSSNAPRQKVPLTPGHGSPTRRAVSP